MRTLSLIALITALLTVNSTAAVVENAAFSRGNEAYVQAEGTSDEEAARELYLKASIAYGEAIETGGHSWEAHFNLGNALLRAGDYGRAALAYERARAIDPLKPEAALNLAICRQAAGLPATRVASRIESWGTRVPMKAWMWTASAAGWALLALLILPRLHGGHRLMSISAALAALLLLATCAAGMSGWHLAAKWQTVTGAATLLHSAPDAEASSIRSLKAAENVKVLRSHAEWLFVRSEQGDEGWIGAAEAASVWNR